MNNIHIEYVKSPIGELIIGAYEGKLCLLDYRYRKMREQVDNRLKRGLGAEYVEQKDSVICQTKRQLDEYLTGVRTQFTLPLLLIGSEFQQTVWRGLMKVSYGQTSTYLQLAKDIGNEKSVRAVANANGANSVSLIVPCHRIIGSNGDLVGYGGGLAIKQKLLKLESNYDLFQCL